MEIEDAIGIIKDLTRELREDGYIKVANDMAIAALEKQIPKPPGNKVRDEYKILGKNYYCQCGVMFVDFERNGTNFCGQCGQKLREVRNDKTD